MVSFVTIKLDRAGARTRRVEIRVTVTSLASVQVRCNRCFRSSPMDVHQNQEAMMWPKWTFFFQNSFYSFRL